MSGYDEPIKSILGFIQPYLPEKAAKKLASHPFKVDYLNYDWGLNEQ